MPTTFDISETVRTTGAMQNPSDCVRNKVAEDYSISLLALILTASSDSCPDQRGEDGRCIHYSFSRGTPLLAQLFAASAR